MLKVPKISIGTRGRVNRAAAGAVRRWCRSKDLSAFGEIVTMSQADELTVYLSDDRVSMNGCCVGLVFPTSDSVSTDDASELMEALLDTDWGGWCLLGIRSRSILEDPRRTPRLLDWAANAFEAASDDLVFPPIGSHPRRSIWAQPSAVYAALCHRGLVDGTWVDAAQHREVLTRTPCAWKT